MRIINCARGGLIDENALKAAIDNGHVAGAALDVFETEPAKENILFGNEKVVATPHLGASTTEAQENVALQVAEQISDYLLTGAITNALNMPSISASEAQKVRPWISLAEKLGSFAGQLTGASLTGVEIVYEGTPSMLNTRALTQAALAGLLKPMLAEVNMVNAPVIAKERGIKVSETRRDAQGVYEGYIKLVVSMSDGTTRRVAGTVFSDGRPRLIQIKDISLDAEFAPHMLYIVNEDKPGFIGKLGTMLGDAKVNIANFTLGRSAPGQDAIALIEVDGPVPDAVAEAVAKLPQVKHAKPLAFYGFKAATASSRVAMLPMFVRNRPSRTRWTISLSWARSHSTTKSTAKPSSGRGTGGPTTDTSVPPARIRRADRLPMSPPMTSNTKSTPPTSFSASLSRSTNSFAPKSSAF